MKTKEKTKYCSFCGHGVVQTLVFAETVDHYYGHEISGFRYDAYNKETGKRQFCMKFECPHFVNKFWNSSYHDSYTEDKIITV